MAQMAELRPSPGAAKRERGSAKPQDAKRERGSAKPQDAKRERGSAKPKDAKRERGSAKPQEMPRRPLPAGGARFRSYNRWLQEKFGERVYKVIVDAGFTCPNRDGTVTVGGC